MISNCGHDENGRYSGGAAGDQTGTEWQVVPWYSRPWNVVLRPPAQAAQLIATMARQCADNNHIGYDQNQRYTFWDNLRAVGYDPTRITANCETDCSAGVAAICKAAGYRLGMAALQGISIYAYTGNLRSVLLQAGFTQLTDPKYLTSGDYLLAGDVLLLEGSHTAINLDNGKNAEGGDDMALIDAWRANTRIYKTVCRFAKVTANNVKLRMYPSQDAPTARFDHLDAGNDVLIVGYGKGDEWAKVVFNYGADGAEGWMHTNYLT